MQKTVTIDGQDYTLGTIKTGLGRKLKTQSDPSDFNVAFLAASLQAGGNLEATAEWVDATLPFFGVFTVLWAAACEVNGLKAGESQPAGPASTSPSSTVQ